VFLQMVSLERVASVAKLKIEAERLRQSAALSQEEVAALDFDAIGRFWQSDLGRQICSHTDSVRRELPFTAKFSPTDLTEMGLPVKDGLSEDEFIVVQGVVDLVVFRPEGISILDFKTDHVERHDLAGKLDQYAPQLKLYGLALGRIYRQPVKNRWLHFLALGESCLV
jgi:ATP-dependent helicase/nuclease subunit A